MPGEVCCVCGRPIGGAAKLLGGRNFCEEHYSRVARDRRGAWAAMVALIVGLAAFVALVFFFAPSLRDAVQGDALIVTGLVLALVPAVVWLVVFYSQDRAEPEPKRYVLALFALGALLATGIGQPLINGFFRVNEWAGSSTLLRLIAGITIVGAVQESLKYAAVRYSIFNSTEFDERIDGIIYGAAAGLGYATALNVMFVVNNGGVDLGFGAVRVAVTALAHASFAGVVGYFLGRAKFENRGPFWMPVGVLIAAILNGVVTTVLVEITRSGLQTTPIVGLIAAAVIAMATFLLLFSILQRSNRALARSAG
jgi:protease PrsW